MVLLRSTKAEVWYIDFAVGGLVFILILVIFLNRLDAMEQEGPDSAAAILTQALSISATLMTEGSPQAWNGSTVHIPGITNGNGRISEERWAAIVKMEEAALRGLLRTVDNFFVFIERQDGCLAEVDGRYGAGSGKVRAESSEGDEGEEDEGEDEGGGDGSGEDGSCRTEQGLRIGARMPDDLVQVTRLVIYEAQPAKLKVYVWR